MWVNLEPIFAEDMRYGGERSRNLDALSARLRELGQLLREDKIYKADSQQFVIEYPQYPRTPYREPRRTFRDMREEMQNELTIQPKFTASYRFDTTEGTLHTVKPPEAPRLPASILAALVAHYPTVAEVAEQIERRRTGENAILPPPANGQNNIPAQNDDDEEAYLTERKPKG